MKLIGAYRLFLIGAAIGAVGGYIYYSTIGCASGTCVITSNPWGSMIYGALAGGLALNLFKKQKEKNDKHV